MVNKPKKAGELNESSIDQERLTSLVNSMADAVIAVDENQQVALYNGAALNILDLNSNLKNKYLKSLMNIIDKNNQTVDIDELIGKATTQYTSRDLRLKYPNSDIINLYISIAPVHLGYGVKGKKGHVLLIRDITREKSLEEERDEFISVISHELRTPIAIAEGNISNALFTVGKFSDIPPSVNESLKSAHDQTIFLSDMINDLSTLSRAETGHLTVEIEPINVYHLLKNLEQNYKKAAESKNLILTAHPDPNLELLKSGRLYVLEILQNFVTNAIKYTEKGSISIYAHAKNKGVLFEISDTGIGLSKADQEKVFDKFFRSEDYRTRKNNGTGLGLYVTIKLANLLNAEINLESEIDKGSTFSIFVPNLQ